MKSSFFGLAFLLIAFAVSGHAATNPPPFYEVHVLDIFDQFYARSGMLRNERGDVAALVGTNEDYAVDHLLIFGNGQTNIVPLPPLNYTSHSLMGFNVEGDAVIAADYTGLLFRSGEIINLSNLVDATYFTRVAINDHGMLVGGAQPAGGGPAFAFSYYRGRQKTFPHLVSNSHALGGAVNNHGRIVGGAQFWSGALGVFNLYHAVVFRKPRPHDLGVLGEGLLSIATGLNERGDIIGFSTTATNDATQQAFHYRAGRMKKLSPLPGGFRSEAIAINNHRQIIGLSWSGDPEEPTSRAVIYIHGVVYDLSTCISAQNILAIVKVYSIDEHGVILAQTSEGEVVLLTPAKRPSEF